MSVVGLLRALLGMTFWASLGYLLGYLQGWPLFGAWLGASVSLTWRGLRELIGAQRLVHWLQLAQGDASEQRGLDSAGSAPRGRGVWGELGYRVERLLRQRDAVIRNERLRLEEFLRGIEASPNGVMLIDAGEQIVWCNRISAQHFGLDPQRDLFQRLTNLIRHPAFVENFQRRADESGEALVLQLAPGRVLSVLIRSYGKGQSLVLSQDITERQRVESMRRDFVANVSHEIRTPLTVLSGLIDTLSSLPLDEGERKRLLGLMGQQAQRMQSLVTDFLTLAQLEGSPRPTVDRWSRLCHLLDQVEIEARSLSAGRHRLEFPAEQESEFDRTEIAGQSTELLSALTNLVSNAVRYTPEGGMVRVSWSRTTDGRGVFTVTDSGIGIAREHLPRLTERFYRVDGSRSRETGGTGLGLSIVKHVVQRHDGELLIDSEFGRGSTFRLVLPPARLRVSVRKAPMPDRV
jgi:two-component system phosphate regulon sensor histidine kinase PhoR